MSATVQHADTLQKRMCEILPNGEYEAILELPNTWREVVVHGLPPEFVRDAESNVGHCDKATFGLLGNKVVGTLVMCKEEELTTRKNFSVRLTVCVDDTYIARFTLLYNKPLNSFHCDIFKDKPECGLVVVDPLRISVENYQHSALLKIISAILGA